MNQTNAGTSSGFPKIKNVFTLSKVRKDAKASRLSRAAVMFGSMLMLALQLLAGSANAVNIPVSSFTCTQAMTATTTCVGSGFYASGWATGTGYWQYVLNTVGYTGSGIAMTFSNTKSSAAGPTTGQVYYNIGAGDVAVGSAFTVTTSCVSQSITLPAVCLGVSNLIVKVKMTGATASTATHRISAQNVFDAASSTCTGSPAIASVSAGSNPICGGSSSVLTLTGATAGTGITYQWQSSPNNSTWTNITGATGLTYTATPSASTYYRAVTTCSGSGASTNSTSTLVTVNVVTVAPITGLNAAPLLVGGSDALADATTGGVWSSSAASIASVDASGVLTGVYGGTAVISYKVTNPTTGCVGTQSVNVNVVWPNTLALYAGVNGNSTSVIPVPNDAVSSLYTTGFGTNTPCTSGGFSGLTVNVADSIINEDSAHVGYIIYANAGYTLNLYRIHAKARVSSTGPTEARIGYRYWQAGLASGWAFEAADNALVSGTCGNSANSWDFNTGDPTNPNPNINGADSIEVAVFPLAPGANTGTFQLNSLEAYGIVTADTNCSVINTTVDSVLPSIVNICDSAAWFLNYNLGSGGVAGAGISYQWEVSTTSPTSGYDPIDGATGVVYQTPVISTSSPIDTFYYRVAVSCDGGGTAYSAPNLVTVHPTPANAGTISGGLSSTVLPHGHMLIGAPTYTLSSTIPGGTWTSNDTSTISINPTSGVATPNIQGDAVITYRTLVNGCYGTSKDTFYAYHPNTKALYVGTGGNSLNVFAVAGTTGTTATDLTLVNWDSATACQSGGRSGLVNTTTVKDPATNGSLVTRVAAASTSFTASNIIATVRDQNTGTYLAYLGYKPVGSSTWTTSTTPVNVEFDDCGYSHNELSFPVSVTVDAAGVDFAIFGYNASATTQTLQVNSLSVIGDGPALMKGAGVNGLEANTANVQLYPNPVENTLNVTASQNVNVVILSIDGKKLLEQKNASSINVSSLMSGMYMIQVYDETNKSLLKTEKFIKKISFKD